PGAAVVLLCVAGWTWGGPEMAPKPPNVRRAPAQPSCSSVLRDGLGGAPKWPPSLQMFVAPGAAVVFLCVAGWTWGGPRSGRHRPHPPKCSSRPGAAVVLLGVAGWTWGRRNRPMPPNVRPAPAQPGRSSVLRDGLGGPEIAPMPPNARRAPAQPSRSSVLPDGLGGPTSPPRPQTLVAPRRSRRAPRCCALHFGAPE